MPPPVKMSREADQLAALLDEFLERPTRSMPEHRV